MALTTDEGPLDPGRSMSSPKRILLVDDEADVLQVLGQMLSSMGYQAETSASGEEALAKLLPQTDLVLLDVKMPGLDGFEVARRIRKNPATRDIPIIMVTALGSRPDRLNAVQAGASDFVQKPVDATELKVRVEAQLKLKESQDEVKRQRAELQRAYAAEKELLEKTLRGSVRVLIDILGLVNPLVFSRLEHIRRIVRQICQNLELPNAWQYELAAMVSQLGWVAVPPEVTEKYFAGQPLNIDEAKMVDSHSAITADILARIPRLALVAGMVRGQADAHAKELYAGNLKHRDAASLGSLILRTVIQYDLLLSRGMTHREAMTVLRKSGYRYDSAILTALQSVLVDKEGKPLRLESRYVKLSQLEADTMILGEDLLSRGERGILLARKGQEVTPALLARIKNSTAKEDLDRKMQVLVSRSSSAEGGPADGPEPPG